MTCPLISINLFNMCPILTTFAFTSLVTARVCETLWLLVKIIFHVAISQIHMIVPAISGVIHLALA